MTDTPGAAPRPRRPKGRVLAAGGVVLLSFVAAPPGAGAQTAEELEYGRYLAQECAGCHRLGASYNGGNYSGVPSITGYAPDAFLEKLSNKRSAASAILRDTIGTLDAGQLRLIAMYLSTLPPE